MRQYTLEYGKHGIRANGIKADRIRSGILNNSLITKSFTVSIFLLSVPKHDFLSNEQLEIKMKTKNNPKILFTEVTLNSFLSF